MSLHFDDAVATSTGVFIVIAMNCLSSFGVNVQAAALRERRPVLVQDEDPLLSLEDSQAQTQAQSQPPKVFPFLPLAVRPWLWLIGFIAYLVPQVFGSILALNFISPILLAPLGSSGLVFNVYFSSLLVGTKVGPWDYVATGLIVAGGSIVSLFGNVDVELKDFDTLFKLFKSSLFRSYFSSIIALLLICLFTAIALEIRKSRLLIAARELEFEDVGGPEAEARIEVLQVGATAYDHHIGFLYSSCGGIAATLTLTIMKCGLNLISSASGIMDKPSVQSWSEILISVFLLITIATSIVLQLVTLNKAIVFISPLIAVPVFYTFFTSLSVSNTLVMVFAVPGIELPDGIAFMVQMAIVGVTIIVGGVWVLSYSSMAGRK